MRADSIARPWSLVALVLLGGAIGCGDDSLAEASRPGISHDGGAQGSDADRTDLSLSSDGGDTHDATVADVTRERPATISEEEWARRSGPQAVVHDVVTHASQGCPWQKIGQEFSVQPTVGCRVRPGTSPNTIRDCDIEPYCTSHDECREKPFGRCRGSASNRCVYPSVDLPICSANADCTSINGTCSPLVGTDTYCYPTGRCEKRERRCSYRSEGCDSDADCTAFPSGFCQKRLISLRCEYLQCVADTDCEPGKRCACTATSSGNMCVSADCQTDADCGEGRTCRLEIGCHGRAVGYHCSSPSDSCSAKEDCIDGGGYCVFSSGVWSCAPLLCPPVGP